MKTTHLTTIATAFSPFSALSKTPRLFLTLLPANAHKRMKITTTILPRDSPLPSTLEVAFKDGKTLKYKWEKQAPGSGLLEGDSGEKKKAAVATKIKLEDIVLEVERHERMLARKEELSG